MTIAQPKPNYSRWRAISLATVYLLMGVHIAYWKLAGVTLAPLELNEVLYTIHLGIITAGLIFMGLTMIATVVAGRFFCSWMCHILALQDASEWLLKKIKIKPRHIRSRTLLWVPFLAMGYMFILPQIERLYKGLPAISFRIQTESEGWASFITHDFWRNLPGIGVTLSTFLICGFFVIYLLGSRSFCQYACPYGALYAVADRIAPGKIKLTGDCNQCGKCTAVCSSHIKVHQEIHHFGKVVDHNCLKDLDCVQVCPNDAIAFGFTKPAFFSTLGSQPSVRKKYDFSIWEDVSLLLLFLLFTVIFFGLYDTIPFLLAVGLAIAGASLTMKLFMLRRRSFSMINKIVLKRSGKLTYPGIFFSAGVSVMILFSIHSMYIRYHQLTGEFWYNKVQVQQKGISNGAGPSIDRVMLDKSFKHLDITYRYGFYRSASLLRQLASISITNDNNDMAISYLKAMVEKLPDDSEARLRLAKLLIVTGKESEALPHLRFISGLPAFEDHLKIIKSDALATLGHLEELSGFASEALLHYKQALEVSDENHDAVLAIGVINARSGNFSDAEQYLLKAAAFFNDAPVIENNLAFIYMKQKRYSDAEFRLKNLVKINPANQQALYNLAMTEAALGLKNEAIQQLNNILLLNPDHKNARLALEVLDKNNSREKRQIQ